MCDFMSYIKQGKNLYYLTDEIIEERMREPNHTFTFDEFSSAIGHIAIIKHFGGSFHPNGIHCEGLFRLPKEIAFLINEGRMVKMAAASDPSYSELRYDSDGYLISGYIRREGSHPIPLTPYTCHGTSHRQYLAAINRFFKSPDSAKIRQEMPDAYANLTAMLNKIISKEYVDGLSSDFARAAKNKGYVNLFTIFDWSNAAAEQDLPSDYYKELNRMFEPFGL
jgi:hypothetical protein